MVTVLPFSSFWSVEVAPEAAAATTAAVLFSLDGGANGEGPSLELARSHGLTGGTERPAIINHTIFQRPHG